MKNSKDYLIIVLLLLIVGCSEDSNPKSDEQKYFLYYKWCFNYPDFCKNRYNYELVNNGFLLDEKKIKSIYPTLKDSLIDLFNVYLSNFQIYDEQALQVSIRNQGIEKGYIFYKYLTNMSSNGFVVNEDYYLRQIEYPIEETGRKKMMILSFWKQKVKQPDSEAAFIEWSSIRVDSIPIKWGLYDSYPIYMWGINKTTDTLKTNLSLECIKMMFPEFEGEYIYKNYKKIEINYEYSTFQKEFYDSIKFIE
jgi:hypothetical protein